MARLFLALAASLAAAAAAMDSNDALLLLQAGAQRLQEARIADASSNATTDTFEIVGKLKAQAQHLRTQATKEIADHQAGYEQQLQKLRDEVAQMKQNSLKRHKFLEKHRSANRELLKNATDLQHECDSLDVVARSLLGNLSNVEEGIVHAVRMAEEAKNESVLEVIDEQRTLAKLKRDKFERQRLVAQITKDAGRDVALVQMDPERTQEIISAFTKTFDAARREEHATLEKDKRRFDEAAAALEKEKNAIMSERAATEAEIKKAYQVKVKLEKLMSELKANHSYLQDRNSGLRRFLRHVSVAKIGNERTAKKAHQRSLAARKHGKHANGTKRGNGTSVLRLLNHSTAA